VTTTKKTQSVNRRWCVVFILRDQSVKVVGLFNNRTKAWSYMDEITTKNPHKFLGAKITQVRNPRDTSLDGRDIE
jgi:hypothetical protein